jgi:hypothetical protein
MKFTGPISFMLMACLLAGCSTQILEEVSDISIPHDCREPTKLFRSFTVRAKNVSWSGSQGAKEKTSILTVQLTFENVMKWPMALSNSGNGILYSVEYSLSGEDGTRYAPKEATGVTKGDAIHQPIQTDQPGEGQLIFHVPKANYVLGIEQKFAGNPVTAQREDHFSACKIPSHDFTAPKPVNRGTTSGVY